MTERTIDNFFTPSRTSVKRHRSYSSPGNSEEDQKMGNEKVCDLTQEELITSLTVTLGNMLDSKLSNLATKEDFRNLTEKVTKLEEENKALRKEIQSMKSRENYIVDKLIDLESRSRRNNLIFKGLPGAENDKDCKLLITNFCNDMFGAGNKMWINRAHHLGNNKKTVIAHFPEDSDIDYIMSRTSSLKNTGFVVHGDFPREIRVKRACLMSLRREIKRVAGRRKMPLVHDHLVVEGCRFTWQDGKLMAGRFEGKDKLRSLIGRDFSEFLQQLSEGDLRRPIQQQHTANTETTTAAVASNGSGGGDNRQHAGGGSKQHTGGGERHNGDDGKNRNGKDPASNGV